MARRLPKYLVPAIIGVPSVVLAAVVMTPSFAGMTQPGGPADPRPSTTAPAAPATPEPSVAATPDVGVTPTPDWTDDFPYPSPTTKRDPLRDPLPPSPGGACTACVNDPVTNW